MRPRLGGVKGVLVVIPLVLVVGLTACYIFRRQIQHWRIERSTSQFEKRPTQARADALVGWLDSTKPTAEQAERIVRLLARPTLSYLVGSRPDDPTVIAVGRRFRAKFYRMAVSAEVALWVDDRRQSIRVMRHVSSISRASYFLRLAPSANVTSRSKVEIRFEYSLYPYLEESKWLWPVPGRWFPWNLVPLHAVTRPTPPLPREPLYRCAFSVPVEIVTGHRRPARKAAVVSNAELDKAMHAAFTSRCERGYLCSYETTAAARIGIGAVEISYNNLPTAVAFELFFKQPDGSQLPPKPAAGTVTIPAGGSGSFFVGPSDFCIEQTGRYTGTILLKTDADSPLSDPAIESIWDGQLELPMDGRFIVVEDKNR
jgi:hypothetical protein